MSNILEPLKIDLLSSWFFVMCGQPSPPNTGVVKGGTVVSLSPAFSELSPVGGVKRNQEFKKYLESQDHFEICMALYGKGGGGGAGWRRLSY